MIYDSVTGKGVKKRYIGNPNPRKLEMLRRSTMAQLLQKGIDIYFDKWDISLSDVQLADSDGILIELTDLNCTLDSYFTRNDYKPSKHKIYVMVYEKVCLISLVQLYILFL